MNARPRVPYAEQDEILLTLSRWHRQSEALLLSRLYGTPESGEEIDDEDGDGGLPPLPPLDDEYTASGREEE